MEEIDKRLVKECEQYGVDINSVPVGPCSELEALELRLQILVLEKKLSASRTSRWYKALEVETLQKTVKDLEERERKLREEREEHMKELRRLYNGGGKPKGAKGSNGRRSRKETVTTSSGKPKTGASTKKGRNRKRKSSPRPADVKKKRGRPPGSSGKKSEVPGDLGQSVSVNVITVGNTGVSEEGLGPCPRPKRIRKPSPKMQDPFFEVAPISTLPATAASVTDGGDKSVKNQGKYPCDHCGRALSDRSRLIQHVARFHSGDGDVTDSAGEFKCEHCEKSYVERYRLQRHYRMSHQIDLK